MKDVNTVTLVCRLTRDPELRSLPSGMDVCSLRVAFTTSRKDGNGEWIDVPNYVDVTVWGRQAETCARHLSKGRQVCVLGRLQWREWQTESGGKRQSIEVVAEQVQFLGSKDDNPAGFAERPAAPAGQHAPEPPPAAAQDDDIPF